LEDFPKLVDNSFESVMKQSNLPVLTRARIWSWAPDTLRERTYALLAETFRSQSEAEGLDPDRAFPPPKNFDPMKSKAPAPEKGADARSSAVPDAEFDRVTP
jgi:hypothetical protein